MRYVDLGSVQAVRDGLLEQVSTLENILDELGNAEQKVPTFTDMEEIRHCLNKSLQEVEVDIRGMKSLASCLEEVRHIYQNTERKITETYDLDTVAFPKTEFRTSRLRVAEGCEEWLRFR